MKHSRCFIQEILIQGIGEQVLVEKSNRVLWGSLEMNNSRKPFAVLRIETVRSYGVTRAWTEGLPDKN